MVNKCTVAIWILQTTNVYIPTINLHISFKHFFQMFSIQRTFEMKYIYSSEINSDFKAICYLIKWNSIWLYGLHISAPLRYIFHHHIVASMDCLAAQSSLPFIIHTFCREHFPDINAVAGNLCNAHLIQTEYNQKTFVQIIKH